MAAAKTLIRPCVLSCVALRTTTPLPRCRFPSSTCLPTKPFASISVPAKIAASYCQTKLGTRGSRSTKSEGGYVVRRRFGIKATNVSESGSIDSPMMQSMEKKIKEQLNADEVIVKDAYGDGRHVSIYVISSAFEGQSAVNRQRMVYKAIWEELQSTVHAVDQMTTRTPAEATATS